MVSQSFCGGLESVFWSGITGERMGVKNRRSNKESAHNRASLLKIMPPSLSPDPLGLQ